MATRFVFDASRENFAQLVLGNSDKGLVLTYFWTPRAAPCNILMPRLVQLATEYGGKFLLVLANTDELGQIARQYSVSSVPTVKFFRNGQVVHTIHGAESDTTFHQALARFIARDVDIAHAQALETQRRGDTEQARRQLAEAALADPENPRLPADLAKLLMAEGAYQPAQDLLSTLPVPLRADAEIERLLTHLDFILTAQQAPSASELLQRIADEPNDLAARFQLASVRLVADDLENALTELLEITRRDRAFRHDIGRRGLVTLFDMLGNALPLTARYRPKLMSI